MQRVIRVLPVAALEGGRSEASGERAHQLRPLLPEAFEDEDPGTPVIGKNE
jgi:hypothetical protein